MRIHSRAVLHLAFSFTFYSRSTVTLSKMKQFPKRNKWINLWLVMMEPVVNINTVLELLQYLFGFWLCISDLMLQAIFLLCILGHNSNSVQTVALESMMYDSKWFSLITEAHAVETEYSECIYQTIPYLFPLCWIVAVAQTPSIHRDSG